MSHTFTRKELYELVWSEPVSKFSKRYNLSDNGFVKAIKGGNIPRPPRGYWAKLAAGKKVTKPPLPPRGVGMSDEVSVGARFHNRGVSDEFLLNNDLLPLPELEGPIADVLETVEAMVKGLKFSRSLKKPHRLIRQVLERDEERRLKYIRSGGFSWDEPKFDSSFEQRRLRIINALFTAASKLGFSPNIHVKSAGQLSICVNDSTVQFSLEPESFKEKRYREDREAIQKTNLAMRLKLTSYQLPDDFHEGWKDTDDVKLESQLPEIIKILIWSAEVQYRNGRINHHEWLSERKATAEEREHQRREAEKQAEIERQIALEKARVDKLLTDADNFRKAKAIRQYVSDVLDEVTGEETTAWAKWALEQADKIDPVKSKSFIEHV